jgi:hypothetical protein
MRAEGVGGSSSVSSIGGGGSGKVCHKLFRKMDRNHDGVVTRDEARQSGAFRFLQIAQSNDDEKKVFDKIDTNHDGSLTESESTAFFTKAFAQSKQLLALATLFVADVPDDDKAAVPSPKEKPTKALKKVAPGGPGVSPQNAAELALQKYMDQSTAAIEATQRVLESRQAEQYTASAEKSDDALAAAASREEVA